MYESTGSRVSLEEELEKKPQKKKTIAETLRCNQAEEESKAEL